MTRWAKTLGTNGWGATPSHYISLVSTMWFDESKVWLPRRSVGESALVISSAWCKKYRAVYPTLLTATYLNTALRESTTFWWRISLSMRVQTTFDHFRFCCRCRFCFLLLFCFIFFLYHNIEVKHWNDSFNDKGIVWHEYHCLYSSRQGPIRLCMARSHIRIGYNRSSSTYRWLYWPKLLCQNKFRLF